MSAGRLVCRSTRGSELERSAWANQFNSPGSLEKRASPDGRGRSSSDRRDRTQRTPVSKYVDGVGDGPHEPELIGTTTRSSFPRRDSAMTAMTSPAIRGSSALVGSSSNRTSGASRGPARWPPAAAARPKLMGIRCHLLRKPYAREQPLGLSAGFGGWLARHAQRGFDHVADHVEVRKQMKLLKDHTHLGPHCAK